jgi:hypothetical protein
MCMFLLHCFRRLASLTLSVLVHSLFQRVGSPLYSLARSLAGFSLVWCHWCVMVLVFVFLILFLGGPWCACYNLATTSAWENFYLVVVVVQGAPVWYIWVARVWVRGHVTMAGVVMSVPRRPPHHWLVVVDALPLLAFLTGSFKCRVWQPTHCPASSPSSPP